MPRLNEETGFIILIVGVAVAVVGLLWMLIRFLPILRTMVVKGFKPFLIVLLGVAIAASPILINKFAPPDDKPLENKTTGERDLSMTGKAGLDYSKELAGKNLTILNAGNPDVTDATLELLKPMAELKSLDLSDSAITDAGLDVIAVLPKIEVVRLARTKVTDVGVKKLLAVKSLKEIDLRGTTVTTAILREWKNADAENRKYLK